MSVFKTFDYIANNLKKLFKLLIKLTVSINKFFYISADVLVFYELIKKFYKFFKSCSVFGNCYCIFIKL